MRRLLTRAAKVADPAKPCLDREPPQEALRRAGVRPTRPRLMVLDVLNDPRCQAMAANELYREMLLRNSPLSLSTLYAVLQTFKRHHLVVVEREAQGLQRFSRMGD